MRIHRARNLLDAVGQNARKLLVGRHVGAGELHVDGRRQTKVQDLADDVCRLEGEFHTGEAFRQFLAQAADVFRAGFALALVQGDEDFTVERADGARVAVRQVDPRVRHAQVVEDGRQLLLGNDLADSGFHFVGQPCGFFNPQARRRAHVQADLAGIHIGEEVAPEHE
ncbi:TNF receptor-associated factor 5-like protein, partial [Corchorus olitorius]